MDSLSRKKYSWCDKTTEVHGRSGLKFLVIYFFLCKSRGSWVVFIIFYAYSKW